jgi:hypothetical protein
MSKMEGKAKGKPVLKRKGSAPSPDSDEDMIEEKMTKLTISKDQFIL